jgi:hypothetical protein
MWFIVDTNVALVANRSAPHASPGCVLSCVERIRDIQDHHTLVIDDGWHILSEYIHLLRQEGQPGVGDEFLKWALTHRSDSARCEQVHITPRQDRRDDCEFEEFPADEALARFDRSDRKFVAVAVAHPHRPPILNAVDTDWWHHRDILSGHGVEVEFVCPDMVPGQSIRRTRT